MRVYANSHYVTPGPTMKQAAEAMGSVDILMNNAGIAAGGTFTQMS